MGELGAEGSVVHQKHFKILGIFDGDLLEAVGKHVLVFLLGSVSNLDHRLVSFELSSDSVINTSGSSPAGGKFSRVLIGLESGELLVSLFDFVYFDDWLDSHLYFLDFIFKFIKLRKLITKFGDLFAVDVFQINVCVFPFFVKGAIGARERLIRAS